jgi:hypothetical protein
MRIIELTQGKRAWVDADFFERARLFNWVSARAKHTWYAYRKEGKKTVWMHREVTEAPTGMEVDHRDGNGLNNFRSNLRLVTHAGNAQSKQTKRSGKTSQYRGVRFHFTSHKWTAQIKRDGLNRWLGGHETEEEAARAYDRAALLLFGSLAQPNFPS